MATVLCSISGIQFKTEHFPINLTQGESHHPIFDVPLPRLWKVFPKWQAGELTKTDSFLLFLAYMKATELVEFRCHVWQRPDTDRIIANNMENLYHTIGNIIQIKHPKFSVPRIVISPETRDLGNVRYWIQTWQQCYEDFCNGLKDVDLRARLVRKEAMLERLIKNPSLKPSRYAKTLASWAAEAAEFPDFSIGIDSESGEDITLSEYWQEIIVKCHTDTNIVSVPEKDLQELITHCEENLDAGSIQAHHLFQTIRNGFKTLTDFFSVGSPTFMILDDGTGNTINSVEKTNLQMLIDSAPAVEPKRTEYVNEFQFIKAKMKWNLAQQNQELVQPVNKTLENL